MIQAPASGGIEGDVERAVRSYLQEAPSGNRPEPLMVNGHEAVEHDGETILLERGCMI